MRVNRLFAHRSVEQLSPRFARRSACILAACFAALFFAGTPALLAGEGDPSSVESAAISPTASEPVNDESLGGRRHLTGDWFGVRDQMSKQGFSFELNLTQFYQGVASGGKDRQFAYGDKLDLYLNFDGGKADLLDGFFFTAHAEARFGDDINASSGLFSLTNFNMEFPKAGEDSAGITRLILSQAVSEELTVFAGKINSLDDFELNFTGRNGIDRFMNSAVTANIINARTVPYSTYGAGFSVINEKNPIFTFVVRDPDNHATTSDLDHLFADGVLLSGTVRIPVLPFGLPGNQKCGVNWNSQSFSAVDVSSGAKVPGEGIAIGQVSGSWAAWYNFDQYLWVSDSDPTVGWGVFGMFGISDGEANPIGWSMTLGIGGNSLVPGRQQDTFGVAYFRIGMSSDFKQLLSSSLAPPGLAQRDEQGVELFYNAALTPWCHLTLDLQIVEPSTKAVDTAVMVGTRLKIEF